MTAAVDATVLLQQIKSEPLSTFLSSLRKPSVLPSPLSTLFPIPSSSSSLGQIIDIHSPSHTGKTSLLYYCITQIVLPNIFPRHNIRLCAGGGRLAVVLDCENRFDVQRLQNVIKTYVGDKIKENAQGGFIHSTPMMGPSDGETEGVVRDALSRVVIFRPTSAMSLLATVKGLTIILSDEESGYKDLTLGLICIDSLTSFHHVLRSASYLQQYYTTLSLSLHALSSVFSIPILVTSYALFPQAPDIDIPGGGRYIGTGPSHDISSRRPVWRQYFPSEWSKGVSGRVVLMKREVRGFMVGISVEEAEREKERRQEVVRRGEVVGWVEGAGGEFEMFVTEEGVRVRV